MFVIYLLLLKLNVKCIMKVMCFDVKFLCKKAQVAQLANERENASEALKEAESIASELHVLPESQLGKLLTDTQAAITPPT